MAPMPMYAYAPPVTRNLVGMDDCSFLNMADWRRVTVRSTHYTHCMVLVLDSKLYRIDCNEDLAANESGLCGVGQTRSKTDFGYLY